MHRLIASCFGTGLILGKVRGSDLGSGTIGALLAFPFAYAVGAWWGWLAQLIATVLVIAISIWSIRPLVGESGDAGWICIDEVAGVFVALVGLTLGPAIVAWVIFRTADIKKDWAPGVAAAEKLPGEVGVTADDLVAGLYGLFAGHILQALL